MKNIKINQIFKSITSINVTSKRGRDFMQVEGKVISYTKNTVKIESLYGAIFTISMNDFLNKNIKK